MAKKRKKADEEFPGYPKYPADEDITRNANRIDENLDDDVLTQVKHNEEPAKRNSPESELRPDEGALDNGEDTENANDESSNFDVGKEDLEALGPKDLSMDGGEDEQLKHRTRPVDFSGEDLDVPGTELDDEGEDLGSEDEENNIYSLGGDEKNNLEESQEHEESL